MKNIIIPCLAAVLLTACEQHANNPTEKNAEPGQVTAQIRPSGIELAGMDNGVRPQDDLFAFMNGTWVANTEIPADKSRWGSFNVLRENSQAQIKAIVDDVATNPTSPGAQQIANLFNSFMDEKRINHLRLQPLAVELAAIDGISSHDDVAGYFARSYQKGGGAPLAFWVGADQKDTNTNIVYFTQSGLGLPDRDYYFDNSEKGQDIRAKYRNYVKTLLTLANTENAEAMADQIIELETAIANPQWTKVENRDPEKTYNKVSADELHALAPELAWNKYLAAQKLDGVQTFIVRQPSYFEQLDDLLSGADVDRWKAYFRFHLLDTYAGYLSDDFAEARFAFRDRELQGQQEQAARWKRAVDVLNGNIGELLGREYVKRYFPSAAKTRMLTLVENLKRAYAQSIQQLDWMSEKTKLAALDKLNKFTTKIGYPDKWRDYSALQLEANDLVGNLMRANRFEFDYMIDKLGKPVDRSEWGMTPQTVNAYYNSTLNEIVFPAAILQPPFFDMNADDAVNYGGIGAVIGHEIGHGFDDQGAKSDGDGKLRNWWTDEDLQKFKQRTNSLSAQYSEYEALPGEFVNGDFTLGENIGDLGGLSIALKAYQLALNGEPSPVIDGFTGEQRVFLGWAQVWRTKQRDAFTSQQLKTDPHSPAYFRVNGVVRNIDAFYEAFNIQKGDKLYLAPEKRVKIW